MKAIVRYVPPGQEHCMYESALLCSAVGSMCQVRIVAFIKCVLVHSAGSMAALFCCSYKFPPTTRYALAQT